MSKCTCLLFSMGLVGALASGCGLEADNPGDAQLRAAKQSAFGLSLEPSAGEANCDASTAPIHFTLGDAAPASGGESQEWAWCSPFRLEFEGLPAGRVAKIDGMLWNSGPHGLWSGKLKLTIATADLAPWETWHKSFVIDGKCTDADEKTATLTFLGPDLDEELMTIDFAHVGIVSLAKASAPKQAPTQDVARFNVELYAEEMVISSYKP